MITLKGKPICDGVAIGTLRYYKRKQHIITRRHIESCEAEIERFEAARVKAVSELQELYDRAFSDVGEATARIFSIHQLMLNDMSYIESVKNIIADQMINAETAVAYTCDNFVQMFENLDDAYMRGRDADVKDVSERVINILCGDRTLPPEFGENSIIISDNLAPSETVLFDKNTVIGFATEYGSQNSHTAILARIMSIPAIIGAKDVNKPEYNGKTAVLDSLDGVIYIDPDEKTLALMKKKQIDYTEHLKMLHRFKGKESITKDGRSIKLYANLGNILDIGSITSNDAEGVGLFRSEFLYMESYDFPSEEIQFNAYREVLEKLGDKPTVIRTLDMGADKRLSYFNMPEEENPLLGTRSIRISLSHRDIFKTQLRAILRASVYGTPAVMFPMITSEWELLEAISVLDEVKGELKAENIPYSENIKIGCMIETPAAAVISDDLAEHLDFVSIGTNDLTQYTLAADMYNENVSKYYDTKHKAVFRLIYKTILNVHSKGKTVMISGDAADNLDITEMFIAMGADCLSVTADKILPLREKIINTDMSKTADELLKKIK